MRYLLLASAALLLNAMPEAVSPAAAQGFQIVNNNYNFNYNYQDDGRYGGPYGRAYAPRYDYRYRPYVGETHDAAVNRIKATHSRFRQHTHPRSLYISPPSYYDWAGW